MFRSERLDDMEEALRVAIDGNQANIWTAMPGIVASVNLSKQTLSVQIAVQGVATAPDGTTTPTTMPLLQDVPICWPRGGGYALTFPIAAGDEVLVVFASRCIDEWWQSGGSNNAQAEIRINDLSDGFAILAPTSQPKKLVGVSSSTVQLRNSIGSTFIEIDGTNINITSPGTVQINAVTANVVASGTATVVGAQIVLDSTLVDIGGIDFLTHTHSGVQTGGGNTGVPNP